MDTPKIPPPRSAPVETAQPAPLSADPGTARTGRRRRLWIVVALVVLLLIAAALALPGWLLGTTSGLVAAVRFADGLGGTRIELTGAKGSVLDGFGAERVRVRAGTVEVEIHDLEATLRDFGFRPLRFDFDRLAASRLDIRLRPSPNPSKELPKTIAAPLAVSAQQLRVSEFALRVGADPNPTTLGARAIVSRVAIGPQGYDIGEAQFEFGPLEAPLVTTLRGTLAGAAPFAVVAEGGLVSSLQDKPVQAKLAASGSLVDLLVAAQVESRGAGGTAEVRLASFGSPVLTALHADLSRIDPKAWAGAAPHADLRIEADLKPLQDAPFGLAGPVRIENRAAGAIDVGRIPVRAAAASLHWRERTLAATDINAQLIRGTANGTFKIQLDAEAEWETDAQFEGVDPAAIHSRLQSLVIDGSGRARRARGESYVEAALRSRGGKAPAALVVDLRANDQRVVLNSGRLTLSSGTLDAQGEIGLTGARRVQLGGRATALNPGLLVRGVDAQLTGAFALDGTLTPKPAGTAQFDLVDSVAFGRPLAGRATVRLAGELLDLDADLAIRNAKLTARGGLGSPERTLDLELAAPALEELLPQLRGAAQAKARLRGSWQQPAVDGQVRASGLRYAGHTINGLALNVAYGGGNDGLMSLHAELDGHRYATNPMVSLRLASLAVEGRPSTHVLSLAAMNADNEPAQMRASGGYAAGRWSGRIEAASLGRPLDLLLLEATPFEVGAKAVRLGPARLQVADAQIEGLRLEVADGVIHTRGEFSHFKPTELVALRPAARAIRVRPSTARDPLVLRGSWQARLGQTADAHILIERSGGDLYAGTGADSAMGVRELRATLNVRANALTAEAVLRGDQLGVVEAKLAASLEREAEAGWRLAPARPWQVKADADLPSIGWINAFLSDRVRETVRLRGALKANLRIEGTPAQPRADGTISGDKLRVAWIEQAMRLENGVLRARVEGDTVWLDELRFSGAPRVQPAHKRAAEAGGREEGFLVASGRLSLPELTGYLQIQAKRLPVLQRVDRWVIATGGANIEFAPQRVQLNGAVTVDAGYVDFSKPNLPSLSSDVVLREPTSKVGAREPRVMVGLDIGIGLGEAFYLRGSGLDTRLTGALRLRSDGKGGVRATGSVNAEDGTFEGYGQKLKIARGRINFQGAPENPGLDVLALRTDLPADAGEIGVSITRTAANPLVRLYSDPPLPDYQTLSWLVLGRPAEQSGGDNIALARAAVGLLAGAGEGVPTTLARQLGIDEISLRSGNVGGGASLLPRQSVAGSLRGGTTSATAGGEIVAVGKRVNEAITLSYEQSLTGVGGVVSIAYRLSQRLSLIARAGTEQALDLVYGFAFD